MPRLSLIHLVLVLSVTVASSYAGDGAAPASAGNQGELPYVFKLLANGQPAIHVFVCNEYEVRADMASQSAVKWIVGHQSHSRPYVSDENGVAAVPFSEVFQPWMDDSTPPQAVYAYDPATGRVAMMKISHRDKRREFSLAMEPPCEVWGTVTCPALEQRGKPWKQHVVLDWNGVRNVFTFSAVDGHFQFLLPPGTYAIRLTGNGQGLGPSEVDDFLVPYGGVPIEGQELPLSVEKNQHQAKVGPVVMNLSALGKLVGSTAPELQNIIGWKNSAPLKLSDLHGKVVVLDFWGFWCGACVMQMPSLMSLYDKYKDQGLVVIGVHDDREKSIVEMDQKLSDIRARVWRGRDIPFPVALDGGGEKGTVAAYHVEEWPTTVVIDREGKLVHVQDHETSMGIEPLIRELLAAEPHGTAK
jgi:thiol-disulfide isomerase/thioredoxin